MWTASLLLAFFFQAPLKGPVVVVGLTDGQKVVVQNPQFSGFLETRDAETVLIYRHNHVHGRMPAGVISRIDFGVYKKGRPFLITVSLRNGQRLEVESERHLFVRVQGQTELGPVSIKHPDPIPGPLRLSTNPPDRYNDLTIQYLEFPAS
jgi:hypothetical protein